MYIRNKAGNRAFNLDKVIELSVVDETKKLKELQPETQEQVYVIRLYYEPQNKTMSEIIATFDNLEEAYAIYDNIIGAMASGASVISLFSDDGKDEDQEAMLEREPDLDL